jgi:hypothetical protein
VRDALFIQTIAVVLAMAGGSIAGCGNGSEPPDHARSTAGHGGAGGSSAGTSASGGGGASGASTSTGGRAGSGGSSAGEHAGGQAGTGGEAGESAGGEAGDIAGTGGAAGADALGVTGPSDKTVLEGTDATFLAIASGQNLVYRWQRQALAPPFADVASGTSTTLTLPSAQLSDDRSLFRVIVSDGADSVTSRAATLSVIPLSAGAFVAVDASSGQSQRDPAYTTLSAATHAGTADLAAGTLASGAFTPDNQGQTSARLSVVLYNNTGVVVTIRAGDLSAHVESTYVGSSLYQNTTSLITNAILAATPDGTSVSAHIGHQVGLTWANGMVVTSRSDIRTTTTTGARVDVLTESLTALGADLVLPEFSVRAGERLWITASLTTSSYGGTTDATDPPMRLRLVLPAGVSLDTNASVTLDWVTN